MIPLRTCAHANALEHDLANRRGEQYAAVIARAGSIRHTHTSITARIPLNEADTARDDGVQAGLEIAATEINQLTGLTSQQAKDTARRDIARMTAAITRDEDEFLNHPDWKRPEPAEHDDPQPIIRPGAPR